MESDLLLDDFEGCSPWESQPEGILYPPPPPKVRPRNVRKEFKAFLTIPMLGTSPVYDSAEDVQPYATIGESSPGGSSACKIGGSMSPDCCIDIDKLELPASLERVKGGIRVAGHRVSLFRIIDELLNGTSPDRLKEMFPTVPERKLEEVVSFCKRHDDAMQKYHAEYQAAFTAGVGSRIGEAPSLAELRRRKSEKAK